jgi:hypothetical protein
MALSLFQIPSPGNCGGCFIRRKKLWLPNRPLFSEFYKRLTRPEGDLICPDFLLLFTRIYMRIAEIVVGFNTF